MTWRQGTAFRLRRFAIRIGGLTFWAVVAVVVLAPLPLGGIRVYHSMLFALAIALALVVWSLLTALGPVRPRLGLGHIWPIAALFAVAPVWALVQLSPLTPVDWHHPMWLLAAQQLGEDAVGRISVAPFDTRMAIARLLTYGGVFWLTYQFGQSPVRARQVLKAIAAAGLVYAAYGLIRYGYDHGTIVFVNWTAPTDYVTSTFYNRNNYATYAGLGLLCAAGLAMTAGLPDQGRSDALGPRSPRWGRIVRGGAWPVVALVCLAPALTLTLSRAGVAASLLGLVTLMVVLGANGAVPPRRVKIAGGAMVALAVLPAALVWSEIASGFERFDQDLAIRGEIYDKAWKAIEQAPVIGVGYGTFGANFRMSQSNATPGHFERAHNTYLENMAELGIPAAAALIGAIGAAAIVCVHGLRRRRFDQLYPAVAVAATVLVGAHAFVDFSLQLPGVALTYAALMGVGCAQSWSSEAHGAPGRHHQQLR